MNGNKVGERLRELQHEITKMGYKNIEGRAIKVPLQFLCKKYGLDLDVAIENLNSSNNI